MFSRMGLTGKFGGAYLLYYNSVWGGGGINTGLCKVYLFRLFSF